MRNLDAILTISKKIKVLYVEDNRVARESTLGLLSNIFTNIVVAVDGVDGLEKFMEDTQGYKLIISDINMPNMNGREMIEKIREIDKNIKIFILSAHNEIETNFIQEVEVYLPKPIDFIRLLKELENHF